MAKLGLSFVASTLLFLTLLPHSSHGIAQNELFPFGESDESLFPNDDASSPMICLSVGFPYFDILRHCLFVNNNGVITFAEGISSYTPDSFPLNSNLKLIAPYWADIDSRNGGTVFYREIADPSLLSMADEYVHSAFIAHQDFRSSLLFIATWDRVGYYNMKNNKLNTFQCVLVTDGQELFVLFLYSEIQWTTGDASGGTNGLGGTPAQVGFNAGDMRNFFSVPGSQMSEIINITQTSNIGVPGVWIFHVSPATVSGGGCAQNEANLNLEVFPSYANILGGDTISVQGPCFEGVSIICEFDGVQRSAVRVSLVEAVCISPPLTRVGRVPFRLFVDGILRGESIFTSLDMEKAHSVDFILNGNTLAFTSGSTANIQWNPQSIFPSVDSSSYTVDFELYELDPGSNTWAKRATLLENTPNDGTQLLRITDPSVVSNDVSAIAIQVTVNERSLDTSHSNPLFSRLLGDQIGRWTAQYYYIQPLVTRGLSRVLCGAWARTESRQTGQALNEIALPCPLQREQAVLPNSGLGEVRLSSFFGNTLYQTQWLNYLHSGASSCFGQNAANTSQGFAVQQECCYDDSGDLITGLPGGGSVDKISQDFSRGGHYLEDVRPYILCCTGLVPNCQEFYDRRPSDDGSRFDPPTPAWMFGDPHLVTLDGHRYTFNGHGEFTLIQTDDDSLTLQGRMSPFNSINATVFSALAAKEGTSDTVMITLSRRGIDAYINGVQIDLELVTEQMFNGVTLSNKGDATIAVTFASGAYLEVKADGDYLSQIAVSLPKVYIGKTRGLLGVYNGEVDDDLMPSGGGEVLLLTVGSQELHNQFGNTWILTDESQSLFTYLPYQNFSTLRDPTFSPLFNPDYSAIEPNHRTLCSNDPFCLYDVFVTGDSDLATKTRQSVSEVDRVEELSIPATCSPPCVNGACVAENSCRCSLGYTGQSCDQPVYSVCVNNPCTNGEKCGVLGGSYYCDSTCTGAAGDNTICALQGSGPCSDNPCLNGGVCSPNASLSLSFVCLCQPDYSGILCGISAMSPCSSNPCQNGGTCMIDQANPTSFTCSCPSGYSGNDCTTVETSNMRTLIIVVVCVICGVVLLVALIGIVLVCLWYVCGNCRKKDKQNRKASVIDSNTRIMSASTILNAPRPSITTSTAGLIESQVPPSHAYSDLNLNKRNEARRLSYSRDPLPSHNVLRTSPNGNQSTVSLNVQNTYNNGHVPVRNMYSHPENSLPVGHATSHNYVNTRQNAPHRRASHSQQGYYDYLRSPDSGTSSQYYSSPSVRLSHPSLPTISHGSGSKNSFNMVAMPTIVVQDRTNNISPDKATDV